MIGKIKRIAVLTGGGDVPGLNSAMKQIVFRAHKAGVEVVGFRRGWGGLVNYRIGGDPDWNDKWVTTLEGLHVRTIDRTGGTFLHTSRTNPGRIKEEDLPEHLKREGQEFPLDLTDTVVANLEALEIDALIPIGGDDTLSYAARLNQAGYPQIAIPKTMDNDVYGTDYCIGFGTAITRSVQAIDDMRTPIGSHERIGLIELFGRNSGETSLIASYLASVDRAIISEVPFDVEKLAEMIVRDKKDNPSNYAIMTMSEGAVPLDGNVAETGKEDAYGHKKLGGIGLQTAEKIHELTGHKVTYQQLGYIMRCGAPDALDRMVAMNFANLAMDMLLDGASGLMTALQDGQYTTVGLNSVIEKVKRVEVDRFYDVAEYKPVIRRVQNLPMFLR
ncbi:MAG: ATP-dependent 6-phosphofructokinase [Gemmatimonadales bacterium]|nr:ATP-dependent 6-phosphofructokinase [Gemmatimonadales bacterium]